MKKSEYAVYKGDEFIDLGTMDYLSKKLNMTINVLKFHTRPIYRRRIKEYGKGLIVIRIED